jgi:hypothetical protein
VVARKRKQQETDAAHRQEEEALVPLLEVELRTLCATDAGMSLLTAVEYSTPDPARRLSLPTLLRPGSEHQWHGSRRHPVFEDRFISRKGSRLT